MNRRVPCSDVVSDGGLTNGLAVAKINWLGLRGASYDDDPWYWSKLGYPGPPHRAFTNRSILDLLVDPRHRSKPFPIYIRI